MNNPVARRKLQLATEAAGGTPANLPTDHQFTGQKQDANGLMYFNSRYYDPHLGVFISPDTIVPDPTNVLLQMYKAKAGRRINPPARCSFVFQ